MKTKLLLTAALIGAAGLPAQAGVYVGFGINLPVPAPVVLTAPVAPVVANIPVVSAPAVTVMTPASPGPDYVWAPGYWTVSGYSRVWVPGCWQCRPAHIEHAHAYGHDHGWHRY